MQADRRTVITIGSSSPGPSAPLFDHDVIDLSGFDTDDDEEDCDDEITFLPTRRSVSLSPSKSASSALSPRRSKKSKTPVQRLRNYIEDILEAEDMLSDNGTLARIHATPGKALPQRSALLFTVHDGRAVLRVEVMLKLISILRSCAATRQKEPLKHSRFTYLSSDNSATEDAQDIDTDDLSRLMRLLHLCMQDGQHLDPFASASKKRPEPHQLDRESKRYRPCDSSPIKEMQRLKKAACTSADLESEEREGQASEEPVATGLTDVTQKLNVLSYSGTAARCALTLLASRFAPEALRCEDALLPCIRVLRSMAQNVLLPMIHACGETSTSIAPLLNELIEGVGVIVQSSQKGKGKGKASTMALVSSEADTCRQASSAVIEALQQGLSSLVHFCALPGWAPSDASISLLASTIMPILFASEPELQSANAQNIKAGKATWSLLARVREDKSSLLASIRLPALGAMESVYKHSSRAQQVFIINTILDHVGEVQDASKQGRRQFGLDNGKSIHSVTALILQLVQTSARPVEQVAISPMAQSIEHKASEVESQDTVSGDVDDTAMFDPTSSTASIDTLRQQLDQSREVATLFAEGLVAKAKAGKGTKGSGESGLGAVLDCLTNDLFETLYLPDWPGSSLLLSQLARLFIACLDDRQSPPDHRGIAVDFLGLLAAKLQESCVRMRNLSSKKVDVREDVDRLNAVVEAKDSRPLDILEQAYGKLVRNLRLRNTAQAVTRNSAAQFIEAQWAVEVACVHRRVTERLDTLQFGVDDQANDAEIGRLNSTLAALRASVMRMLEDKQRWASERQDIMASTQSTDERMESVQELFESVLHTFNYMVTCEHIQERLLDASAGAVVANRSKALRALGAMSQADGTFLQQAVVRAAVQRCLSDESVNVRDGAVGLLGRFVLTNPSYIEPLFLSLKDKIDDAGLLVRKRTLRLFGDIYHKSSNAVVQAEAATEVVSCVLDEEQSMQELAVTLAHGFWFCAAAEVGVVQKAGAEEVDQAPPAAITQAQLDSFTVVASRFTSRASPLENLIRRLLSADLTSASTKQRIDLLVEQMAERIAVFPSEASVTEEMNRVAKALSLLVRIQPSSLTISQAKGLLSRIALNGPSTEMTMLAPLLETYSHCIPTMSKMALSFAQQLQNNLCSLISHPSPYMAVLPEVVKCYTGVILHHTKDYAILTKTLQQCHRLLCSIVSKARSRKVVAVADRNDAVIIRLTALLVEMADFDRIRTDAPEFAASIDVVARRSIREETVTLMLRFLVNASYVPNALLGLHFLFRSSPELLMQDKVQESVLRILQHGKLQDRSILLRSIADVLTEDEARKSKERSECGFGELVGNMESLANPVSFEIIQTYLTSVLSLASEVGLQTIVLEILQHIIMRGMCHPMECLPTLVALETLVDIPRVCGKAQSLHRHLILKAGSNISFRYAICARHAWKLHTSLRGANAMGVQDGRSIAQLWYDTVVDNQPKQARMDLLKALVKAFDVRTAKLECSEDDVRYARFVAECLSLLNFRVVEEVQHVVTELQAILDVSGEQMRIYAMEEVEVDGEEEQDEDELEEEEVERITIMGRMVSVLTYAVTLRQHLVHQYGLSDSSSGGGGGASSSKAPSTPSKASSSRPATRKMPASIVKVTSKSNAQESGLSPYQLAKHALSHFESIMPT